MPIWLDAESMRRLRRADHPELRSPLPTRVVSNGEFLPPPQTMAQRQVQARLGRIADRCGARVGMDPRAYLGSCSGIAAGLLAMNEVYGEVFQVALPEVEDPWLADARRWRLEDQLIFDAQLHFVHDRYAFDGLLNLRELAGQWDPRPRGGRPGFERYKLDNLIKEVFLDSQTDLGLLTGVPSDALDDWLVANGLLAEARGAINDAAGARRLFCQAVFTPGRPGWMEALERTIEAHAPDSWKCYPGGDPLDPASHPWRLDDEALVYPAFERMRRAGITTVCVHEGAPPSPEEGSLGRSGCADLEDLGRAAREWPDLRFVVCNPGLELAGTLPEEHLGRFEKSGRIERISALAELPGRFGVRNLYVGLGTTFASAVVMHPRHCAAILGTLVRDLGAERILWGTDSVLYGSPQWQIEALRRIEIPADMQRAHGFEPLGAEDGPVRNAILGGNAARLYGLDLDPLGRPAELHRDYFSRLRRRYEWAGPRPSNTAYGFVAAC